MSDQRPSDDLVAENGALRQRVAELEAARRQMQALLDSTADLLYAKDTDLRFTLANVSTAQSFGLTKVEDLIGRRDADFFPPDKAALFAAVEQDVITGAVPLIDHAQQVNNPDGTLHDYLTTKLPWRDERGATVGLIGKGRDITAARQAELMLHRYQAQLEEQVAARTEELQHTNARLQQEITQRNEVEESLVYERTLLRTLIDSLPGLIYVKDVNLRFMIGNRAITDLFDLDDPEQIVGKSDRDFFPAPLAEQYACNEQGLLASGQSLINYEEAIVHSDGREQWISTTKALIRDEAERVVALVGYGQDITDRRQAEIERATLQEQIITVQQSALRELSTPLIPIADEVIAMPLIGALDSLRAQQIMETLLEGIVAYQAGSAILDITGVKMVDTQVANALLQVTKAAKLLGTRVIITGIGAEVAQMLVHLGADLSGIVTRSNLQSGIAYALEHRDADNARV